MMKMREKKTMTSMIHLNNPCHAKMTKTTKTLSPTLRKNWRPKTPAKNLKVKATRAKIKSRPRRQKAKG
jgi:hypothetical protein